MNTAFGQNGNGSLYYPGPIGPVSSIRLEVLRDGIEDYEYFNLLRQAVTQVRANSTAMADPVVVTLVAQAEQLLAIDPALVSSMSSYTQDPNALMQTRAQAASLIVQLRAAANR